MSRFVFFCTWSKEECRSHPFRGKFGQLSKALGLTHTLNPAPWRAGRFTFVECRRRCIINCLCNNRRQKSNSKLHKA